MEPGSILFPQPRSSQNPISNSGAARWNKCLGQNYEERTMSFNALSRQATLPASPQVHQRRSSPKPLLLDFLWKLHHIDMID